MTGTTKLSVQHLSKDFDGLQVLDDINIEVAEGEFVCKFTECNGRWGGTSTPMHLIERVVKGPRPPYRAQDFVHSDLAGACFKDVLARVGDAVYDPKTGQGQFIFYNVGPLVAGKLDVISLGATQAEAEAGLLERLPKLLGVS